MLRLTMAQLARGIDARRYSLVMGVHYDGPFGPLAARSRPHSRRAIRWSFCLPGRQKEDKCGRRTIGAFVARRVMTFALDGIAEDPQGGGTVLSPVTSKHRNAV